MATRDLTRKFIEYRNSYKPASIKLEDIGKYFKNVGTTIKRKAKDISLKNKYNKYTKVSLSDTDDDNIDDRNKIYNININNNINGEISSDDDSDGDNKINSINNKRLKLSNNLQSNLKYKPKWMILVNDIDNDLIKLKQQLGLLRKYHNSRLKIRFEDEAYVDEDKNIDDITENITILTKNCHKKLKLIGKDNNNICYEMNQIKLAVIRSRATKIQSITKVFRSVQRQFLQKLKKREERGNKYISNNLSSFDNLNLNLDTIENGLSKEEMLILKEHENDQNKRTQEIIHISKSVNELHLIFQDLSTLIVQQGTILDRIDYNIEKTVEYIERSMIEINKAEKYQKKSKSSILILILLIMISIAIIILIIQHIY